MPKILFPVDGSEVSGRVARALLRRVESYTAPLEIHLVNVQRPVSRDVGQFVDRDDLKDFHREEGLKALADARAVLEEAGCTPIPHVLLDDLPGLAIVRFARDNAVDEIVMGSHGRGAVTSLLLGSVASEVIRQSDIPVTLIK